MKRAVVALVWVSLASPVVSAQVVPSPTPAQQLPGLTVPAVEVVETLPNGMAVSQPLQPVTLEPVAGAPQPVRLEPQLTVEPPRIAEPRTRPFPNSWRSAELLLWWTRSAQLPPMVTANPFALPTLDHPNTLVLFGGSRPDPTGASGGRFTLGWAVGAGNRAGFEIGYQFLGTHSVTDSFRSGGGAYEPLLGVPLVNPLTGAEGVVLFGSPGQNATLDVSQSSRLQGWELTGLGNLAGGSGWQIHALTGYRYLMFNEGVRLDLTSAFQTPLVDPAANTVPGFPSSISHRTATADQFDAHNRFHGAQFGLRTELDRGGFFAELDTKVSLGGTVEVVKASGQTVLVSDLPGGPAVSYFPNGIFGQPTNTRRVSRSAFAVLPEAVMKVGFRFGERSRFYVGYTFLYLSHAVRAADQFDRTVDLSQARPADPLALVLPATRPILPFDRSDFWVQGLSLGLEWRY